CSSDLCVHAVGLHGRSRRSPLRTAGRHYQSGRIRAGQLDRSGNLGGRGRPRHPYGRGVGRLRRQLRKDVLHHRLARVLLAVCAWWDVHCGDASATARNRWHFPTLARTAGREKTHCAAGASPTRGGVAHMEPKTTSALLYLDGITVSFDGFRALNELSFVLEPREMRAIIGPNGAGKTTMMDVITGKTRPDAGDVYFEQGSCDLSKLDETEIAELGIGRKFQKPTVFDMHSVEDNLMLALKNDRRVRATLMWENTPTQQDRIDDILDTTRLKNVRSRVAGSLSHGQKQWLEIGMLLAQEPKLLLVDEPVAGMTDAETLQTAELLKEINRDKTVIVVEHDMAFVRELGVKVTCMHEGSVLAEGTIDQVSTNDRVVEVYLGR